MTGAFLTALVLSLLGTFLVRRWAIRRGFVDHPDDQRRIHSNPTPNVGGIAVAFATIASFVLWSQLALPGIVGRPEIMWMLVGGVLIFALGLWDDIRHIPASTKFGLQLAIAALVYFGGIRILGIGFGDVWSSQLTAVAAFFVTVVFIVGTANAFNLIDGSDGVAGGAAMFASISMGIIFALHGDPLGALMATILVGACLGFLFFNFPPASIFMGDGGSLFLGFTLATLGVITTQKSSTLLAVTIPVIAFGIPLLDTSIAIVRRYLRHEPIFQPDRGHIHHRLRDLGLSSRSVAIFLYVACAACASLSMLLAAPGRSTVLPVFVVAGAVLILGVQRLNVPELHELSKLVGRGLEQRSVISHNVRIHGAARALEGSNSAEELLRILRRTFARSEFSAVELWVDREHGGRLARLESVKASGDGYAAQVRFEQPLRLEDEFEIRVPIRFSDGRMGRLSLFRRPSGSRLFTDVRLVAESWAPAHGGALEGMPAVAGEDEISAGD